MLTRRVFANILRSTFVRQARLQSSNVDVNEIDKFGLEAADWWERSVMLRRSNEVRVPFIRDNVKRSLGVQTLKDVSIIDVGCGGGLLSEALARTGATITAIDPGAKMIEAAKAHQQFDPSIINNLAYENMSIDDVVKQNRKFDVVVASEVVEHVSDLDDFLSKCAETVKPGGSLFVTTINRTDMSYWLGIVLAERVFRLVTPGTHNWEQFVTPEELQNILDKHKVTLQSLQGTTYNPCRGRWKYTSATDVTYMAHFLKSKAI